MCLSQIYRKEARKEGRQFSYTLSFLHLCEIFPVISGWRPSAVFFPLFLVCYSLFESLFDTPLSLIHI